MSRARFNRRLKWTLTILAGALLLIWAISLFVAVTVGTPALLATLGTGLVVIDFPGFGYAFSVHRVDLRWWSHNWMGLEWPYVHRDRSGLSIMIPLWLPFLIVELPAVYLWRSAARR